MEREILFPKRRQRDKKPAIDLQEAKHLVRKTGRSSFDFGKVVSAFGRFLSIIPAPAALKILFRKNFKRKSQQDLIQNV